MTEDSQDLSCFFAKIKLSSYARWQCRETLQRWQAINSVSQAEINANCQFSGLPKIEAQNGN